MPIKIPMTPAGIFLIRYLRPYIMFNQCSHTHTHTHTHTHIYIYIPTHTHIQGTCFLQILDRRSYDPLWRSWLGCSYYATWIISSLIPILRCVFLLLQSLVNMAYLELRILAIFLDLLVCWYIFHFDLLTKSIKSCCVK